MITVEKNINIDTEDINIDTEVSIDLDIEEILESIDEDEVRIIIIPWLIENNYIHDKDILENCINNPFDISCRKLIGNKRLLTKEEEELIIKIANNI